jgi:hypothetical protein
MGRVQRQNGCTNRRQFGAIRTGPGNLRLRRTAWWGRKDSNFQPNDYQPLALSIEQQPFVFVATTALISIFNPSRLVGHRFHDRSRQQTPTEKEMSAESARLMIKPTRGLWHFCYSE